MLKKIAKNNIILISSIIAAGLLIFWFLYNPVRDFEVSLPGLDNRPASSQSDENVNIGETFKEYKKLTSNLKGKWVNFRGSDYDNKVKDGVKLIDGWGNEAPKIMWKVDLGEGHAAPVIYNGKIYMLDYVENKKVDALRCFSLETGEELWRRSYKVHVKRNHGMSRTVPAIDSSHLITIGPKCHVMCTNPNTGELKWGIDMVKDYKTEIPFWYTGQCPLLENDTVVLAPGGTSLLIGVECSTGKVVWETPNTDDWKMSHASVIPMTFGGKKMYIYAAIGGIVGVSAEGQDKGKVLWKTTQFSPAVVAPSPLVLDNGKIYMTAGYGAGGILFQLVKNREGFSVKVLQKFKPKEGIASEQQTPIFHNGYIYVILPKDAGANRNRFVCCKQDDCKNILWTSSKSDRYGLGPYIMADNKFFILNDDGTLSIAKVDNKKFTLLDKKSIIDGHDAWGPLAIADGKLVMRDGKTMVCVDIKAN